VRIPKSSASKIVSASRVARGNQQKIIKKRKALIRSLKDQKKAYNSIKPRLKVLALSIAEHGSKAEALYSQLDGLGAPLEHVSSFENAESWLETMLEAIESEIEEIDSALEAVRFQ
jgi:hypothetical protein